MNEEEIAKYKLIELRKKIGILETGLPGLGNYLSNSQEIIQQVGPEKFWKSIAPTVRMLGILIQKPPERITSVDNLEWLEVLKRFNYRSCGNPICISAPHCTECGLHGSKFDDGHNCEPQHINF